MLGKCTRAAMNVSGGYLTPVVSPTVEVRREDTSGLASLFSDVNGTLPITNPFTAAADGTFTFYADGLALGYRITVTKDAFSSVERHVPIGSAQYQDDDDFTPPDMSELGQSLIAAATEADMQEILQLEPGTDVQVHHANLDTLAGASAPTAAGLAVLTAANSAAQRTALAIAGKTAIPIRAAAMLPRSANGCAPLTSSAGASDQPDVPYLAFDGAAKEYATFEIPMPKSWNEGTVTADFTWRRASGTGAANVVWGIRAVAVSDNETPAAAFGSDATVTDAASTTTANVCKSGETGACTIGGTPSEGDLVLFEVFRDGASGSDTLNSVDAWLTAITLYVTLNETNDA